MQYSMPEVDEGRVPPFALTLAPWATNTAEELHRQFGDDVELTVGALPYPPGRQPPPEPATVPPSVLLDPQEITAELDGPAVVRSGHTLRHGLLVGNLTRRELTIATNGRSQPWWSTRGPGRPSAASPVSRPWPASSSGWQPGLPSGSRC